MSVYVELADRINDVYELNLEPHNQERGFVKVFRKLLTEEEAAMAARLSDHLETVSEIALHTGKDREYVREILKSIALKGIIYECGYEKECQYKLMPFVPGIFEAQLSASHDEEIAAYLEQYSQEMKQIKKEQNEFVIPVNCKIEVQTHHVTLNEIKLYLDKKEKYAVMDCICRSVRKANGRYCGHPIKDMCILIGDYVDYYVEIGNARVATKEEVLQVLLKAEEEGLFHEIYPIEQSDSIFICNCCTCGCMFLELSDRIKRVLRYNNQVMVDKDLCNQCGICIESCPQQVFSWNENGTKIMIEDNKCMHCGLCEMLCAQKAITLE